MSDGSLMAQLSIKTPAFNTGKIGFDYQRLYKNDGLFDLRKIEDINSGIGFGAFGGMGFGSLRYFRNADSLKADTEPEKYAGLFVEIPVSKAGEHLFADIELAFSQFKSVIYNPHYVDPASSGNSYSELTKEFSPSLLNVSAFLKYDITLRDFHPYAFVGINNNIVLTGTNRTTEVIHWNDTSTTVYRDAVNDPASYGMCVITGIGIEYKWISLEGRYQSGRSYSQYTDDVSVFRPVLFALLRIKIHRRMQ